MTVRRLTAEIGSDELVEWMGMDRIEPFGGHIDDLRAVLGPVLVANVVKRMFDVDSEIIDPRRIIPWGDHTAEAGRRAGEPLLHDPSAPDYDAEKHANAIRSLLTPKAKH